MSVDRKRLTLDTLGRVCAAIETILSGQDITLADVQLPQEKEPGETKLEQLQRFKGLLNQTLTELNAGVKRSCQGCGDLLADAALDSMPWATHCGAC